LVGYNTQVLMRLTGSSGSGNTSLVFPYGIPVLTGMYEAGVYGGSGQLGVFSSLSKYKTNIRSLDEQGAAGGANPLWALTPRRFRYTDEVTPKAIHEHPVGYDLDPRDEDPDFYGDDRIEPIEEYGLIAEEVHAVDPVLIVGDITSDVAVWSTHQLVALLVQGVQDLRAAHNDLVNTVGPGAEHALL
jgi:hypothetical protein